MHRKEIWFSFSASRCIQLALCLPQVGFLSKRISGLRCFFAPRYASAVYAMAVCPSVSVCHTKVGGSSIETEKRVDLFLPWELISTFPTLCCKKKWVPTKIPLFWNFTLNSGLIRHGLIELGVGVRAAFDLSETRL